MTEANPWGMVFGVLAGGALGALTRYGAAVWLQRLLASTPYGSFPLSTLSVNVVGSFLLGFVAELGLAGLLSPLLRVAIGTGFIGALTTFSSFELETELLLREGPRLQGVIYLLANLILGFVAILLGRFLATRVGGRM